MERTRRRRRVSIVARKSLWASASCWHHFNGVTWEKKPFVLVCCTKYPLQPGYAILLKYVRLQPAIQECRGRVLAFAWARV